jgi:hypothetical protein
VNELSNESAMLASNERLAVNDEKGRMWKEAIVTYCKILSLHST